MRTPSHSLVAGCGRRWAVVLGLALASSVQAAPIIERATNLIVFIGDGMGLEHVKAARAYKGAPLCFEDWPNTSLVATESLSGITDSAAAGTALATGASVENGVISVAIPGETNELQTVLEYFQGKGKRTGLVTTDLMTGATPAAFGAHASSRYDVDDIADDYLTQTRPNILYGGGGFDVASATDAGYQVVTDFEEMDALDTSIATNVCGWFGDGQMPYEVDGVGELPHLGEMTGHALAVLEREPAGFFLMVEGANIDHAAHLHDIARTVQEVLAFDDAVQVALDWATNRTDTLILVTADHETCGLVVTNDNGPGLDPEVEWTAGWHTATNVGSWAWGAGAEYVGAAVTHSNTHQAIVAASLFQSWCTASADTPTNLTMTWQSAPGEVFRVEYADSIVSPIWQPVATVTADADSFILIDADVGPATNRIYRAVSLP